jgi:aspartyl-tRNA(Asn)/glutamyl-tRNA(Gln) amidotransferase subunit A
MSDLDLSALEIGRKIATGAADPRDLVREALARIQDADKDHAIFVRLLERRALVEADAAHGRARNGTLRSSLDGVPLAWKDNVDIAGAPTEAGSRLLKGRIPERDAPIVSVATQAGLVALGKANMVELAYSGLGYNPHTGTPRNPFDSDVARLPGGSSSGSGVAVARKLTPIAIGTDTGGSVRIPAAWNNLVGLKTTAGRISIEGVVPLSPSLDTIGPMTRNVADAAALFEILSGEPHVDLGAANPGDLRLIALEGPVLNAVEPATRDAIGRAIDTLARGGIAIEPRPLSSVEEAAMVQSAAAAESFALWGSAVAARPGVAFNLVEERVIASGAVTAAQYINAKARLAELGRRFALETAEFDAVLMPTVAMRAPPIAEVEASADAYRAANARALSLPSLANRLGLCAITVPAGFAGTPALPVGLTFLGRPWQERRLLQVASVIERVLQA